MPPIPDLAPSVVAAWRTNRLVTARFVEELPVVLWDESVPGIVPRRKIRGIEIVMAARQLGQRSPSAAVNGLWQWTARAREASGAAGPVSPANSSGGSE